MSRVHTLRTNLETIGRVIRAVSRRVLAHQETRVFSKSILGAESASSEDCELVIVGPGDAQGRETAEAAMVAAREPAGLVAQRLRRGDSFFGWQRERELVAFGWATSHQRRIAGTTLRPGPGRIFLYNFHTLPRFRGQGLYPSLLATMQHQLHVDGATEFIIDVNSRNVSSLHGIRKAGFTLAARVTCLVFFRRWRVNLTRELVDDSVRHLL